MIDKLAEGNYHFERVYFHIGQIPEAVVNQVLEEKREQLATLPGDVIFHNKKDAMQIAREASKERADVGVLNPSDPAPNLGLNTGKNWENGDCAGEEMFAKYGTLLLASPLISDATADPYKVYQHPVPPTFEKFKSAIRIALARHDSHVDTGLFGGLFHKKSVTEGSAMAERVNTGS